LPYYGTNAKDWANTLSVGRLQPGTDLGIEENFWLISDTHFLHHNIAGYSGRPTYMEQRIIQSWHEMVAPDDQIVHLGDVALGNLEQVQPLLAGLPGQKYLLRGNHDQRSDAYYQTLGFTLIPPFSLLFAGWTVSFTHAPHPELVPYPRHVNVHGHTHEKLERSLRLVNCSVEWTDYAPARAASLLADRIELLALSTELERDVPLRYSDWLAREYGGPIMRSDTERFRTEAELNRARETFTRYRIAFVDGQRPGTP